jgi:hypothetical protein
MENLEKTLSYLDWWNRVAPLAPYLFILAVDVLGHMLDDIKYNVEGLTLPKGTCVRDQTLVDDTALWRLNQQQGNGSPRPHHMDLPSGGNPSKLGKSHWIPQDLIRVVNSQEVTLSPTRFHSIRVLFQEKREAPFRVVKNFSHSPNLFYFGSLRSASSTISPRIRENGNGKQPTPWGIHPSLLTQLNMDIWTQGDHPKFL